MKIALGITVVLLLFFIVRCYKLSWQNIQLHSEIFDMATKNEEETDIVKESFLKFISDSREWAFEYIENVQVGLERFINQVEPHIDYYDKYGIAFEGMISPHDSALKTISKEFKELKKLLPEDQPK